jgi:hypothetical protein
MQVKRRSGGKLENWYRTTTEMELQKLPEFRQVCSEEKKCVEFALYYKFVLWFLEIK